MTFNSAYLSGIGLNLLGIALVTILGLAIYFSLKRGLSFLLQREYINQAIYVIGKAVVRWLCLIIVFILILQQLGVTISHIFAGLLTVAGMVAIGFIAVWSVLSNVMCSLLLVAFNVFRIGDELEVIEPAGSDKGLRGRVSGFNFMYTTLTEEAGDDQPPFLVQIPNNIFFQKSLRRRPAAQGESLGQHLLVKPLPFPYRSNSQ